MKKLLLVLISFFSIGLAAQNNLNVTVTDSNGTAAHGVSVFYYTSSSQFWPNGFAGGIAIENFNGRAFTNANGVANFTLFNLNPNDTVFWATQDCAGNIEWGAGMFSMMNPTINGTLNLNCLPGDCDAVIRVSTFTIPGQTINVAEAFALRAFAQTSLPANIPGLWTVNGSGRTGFSSANYDSTSFPSAGAGTAVNITYSRVDSSCTPIAITFGGTGGGSNINCTASFTADTLPNVALGYGVRFNNTSTTNGTIISYQLDMGDGTVLNSSTPVSSHNHVYQNAGTYNVCLTIVSVLGQDTCTDTHCQNVVTASGSNPSPLQCNAFYVVDTVNSGLFQNQLIIWESSNSNGNIVSYSWDFGDGTTINTQYPSHTYATTGVYPVCLTIVALDSAGVDTCVSTFCDSVGFDANGNLVYKNGFTINIIDPATVGLEDLVLESSLVMYPNPAQGEVNLSWDASVNVDRITVFSITGTKVKELSPNGSEVEISGLSSGSYMVRVDSETASKTLRLIVE